MRKCESCDKCCSGYLSGTTRGAYFGDLKPCKYLVGGCTIYNKRPTACFKYFCGWAQEIFPEWMRPDLINAIISVEFDGEKQFLKVVYENELREDVETILNIFCKEHKTYFVKKKIIKINKYE